MEVRIRAELVKTLAILATDIKGNKEEIRDVMLALKTGILTPMAKDIVCWRQWIQAGQFDWNPEIEPAPSWWKDIK